MSRLWVLLAAAALDWLLGDPAWMPPPIRLMGWTFSRLEGGLRRLDTVQIYYLESEGHRVHFYTEDGEFTAPGALKTFEEKLAACPFARCNSGYLVNLAQVRGVQQGVVEVGPYELQVSRPKRKSFLAALADYIGGEGV